VRPRAGYALGNFMPYVTGGLVVGDVNVKSFLNSTGNQGVDFNKTQLGRTAGAGIEVSIYSNWSLKAEYLYVRLADTNGPSNIDLPTTTNFSENILRGGLNYSFKIIVAALTGSVFSVGILAGAFLPIRCLKTTARLISSLPGACPRPDRG